MRSVEEIVRLFRERGLRMTPQRRAILEALAHDTSHPTAEALYQRVRRSLPDLSRMTVYNTLRELVAMGELLEVETDVEEATRFDTNTTPHHHLFCLGCHTLVDIEAVPGAPELGPADARGYTIVRRQVTFYGYCPRCQQEAN